ARAGGLDNSAVGFPFLVTGPAEQCDPNVWRRIPDLLVDGETAGLGRLPCVHLILDRHRWVISFGRSEGKHADDARDTCVGLSPQGQVGAEGMSRDHDWA